MGRVKELISVLLFTAFIVAFYLAFGVYSKNKYNNLIISEENWNNIIDSRELKDDSIINKIKFNDFELMYDKSSNKYFYSMIEDKKGYSPKISYHRNYKNVHIAFKTKITDELIEKNEILEMLVYTDDGYNLINVVCTKLPLLSINYEVGAEITNDIYTEIDLSLYDNRKNIVKRNIYSSGNIKYRGASALAHDKKNYRINLVENDHNNHISLLGMRDDDDWILYSAYNDQEKIRNVFSTKLWYECCRGNNIFKVSNSTQYKYVELFINGIYNGLYALGYPIDEKSTSVTENEYMFKKISWEHSEVNELDENGKMLGYEIKNNVFDNNLGYKKLNEYYKTLSSDDINAIYDMIDINNSIDLYLFYNFIQGGDNATENKLKNTYLTMKKYENGYKIIYTPWDMDLTLGNAYSDYDRMGTGMYSSDPSVNNIMEINPIYRLKELDSDIGKKIYERYIYLRKNAWSDENINKILDEYEDDIYNSGAFLRDSEKWKDGFYNDSSVKLTEFRNYISLRLYYMDKYMEEYIGYSTN